MVILRDAGSSAALASGSPDIVRVVVGLSPVRSGMKLWGPAFTVRGRSGDNLALHRALAAAHEGDVIVAQLTGDVERGHWGDLMSIAAQAVGLAGLVIDASIRDKASIGVRSFPVFHRGTQPSPAAKQFAGELQILVTIHGVEVRPGDGVFADDDGIVVIPARQVGEAVAAGSDIDLREQEIAARLEAGETTMIVLGLET